MGPDSEDESIKIRVLGVVVPDCMGGCGAPMEPPFLMCDGCLLRLPGDIGLAVVQTGAVHEVAVQNYAQAASFAMGWFRGHPWPWSDPNPVTRDTMAQTKDEVARAMRGEQ